MYVLDTNVVSEFIKTHPDIGVMSWLVSMPREVLLLPSVVIAELYFGIERLPAGKRRNGLMDFADAFVAAGGVGGILPFEEAEARAYAKIGAYRQSTGKPMSIADAQIAATAAVRNLPVVTRNVRHFENCGIEVINPWDAQPQ
jgi:predicted nucleic acid-binding protein